MIGGISLTAKEFRFSPIQKKILTILTVKGSTRRTKIYPILDSTRRTYLEVTRLTRALPKENL